MPTSATSYTRTKSNLGVYDASKRFGRLISSGKDALDLLHRMSTNDLKPLFDRAGAGAQTVLTNEKGRIVDVLTVINRGSDALLVTSADREQAIIQWLDKFTIMEDAHFQRATEDIAQFLLIGPRSLEFVRRFLNEDLISTPQFHSYRAEISGIPALIQKSARIAESGWSIFVDRTFADDLLRSLAADLLETGGAVIEDDTFEVLRIEAGIPAAPSELNDRHNPLEAALVSAVSFTKGCYIGQEVIARLDSYDKVQRHLMGLRVESDSAAAFAELDEARKLAAAENEGVMALPLKTASGESVGELTSVALSPGLGTVIGLGYIRVAYANPGQHLTIALPGGILLPAAIEKLPFELELA